MTLPPLSLNKSLFFSIVVFIFVSLMMSDTEHLFICMLAVYMLEKRLFRSFVHSLTGLVFLLLNCMNPSCILNINPLSYIWFAVTFSRPLRQYFSMTFGHWEHLLCFPWSGSFAVAHLGSHFYAQNGMIELLRELDITYCWAPKVSLTLTLHLNPTTSLISIPDLHLKRFDWDWKCFFEIFS